MTLTGVRGLLVDVDGTLLVHDRPIPGSVEAIAALRRAALPFLLLTNTTRRSRRATAERLQATGFDIRPEAIVTPARLARGAGFTFERMNSAFRWLRRGAALVALHRNPWWERSDPEGPVLDAGAYVAALEYATGRTAEVVGKPSPTFFQLALAELGLPAEATLVVGDDLEMDVAAGARVGCGTALVRTGRDRDARVGGPRPDLVLDSIADLPERLASSVP